MSEQTEEKKTPIAKHEISVNILQLLVDGYISSIQKELKKANIPDVINVLLMEYYPKQFYMIILNSKTLQLTFMDTSKDVKILSNPIIPLNDDEKLNEKLMATKEVGVCYKEGIKLENLPEKIQQKLSPNAEYNAIFQFCGVTEKWQDTTKSCSVLLYSVNNNNLYYYKLPSSPFTASYSDIIYSDIYGLIAFGRLSNTGNIAILDLKNEEWNLQKLSSDSSDNLFPKQLDYTPACCMIDEKQLFFVNGGDSHGFHNKKAAIYDLKMKKCSILHTNNPFEATECGITYCCNTNKVYIGGAQNIRFRKKVIRTYDLNKNIFSDFYSNTKNPYERRPILWTDKSGTILNIAGIYPSDETLYHEWTDLRGPIKWINNNNFSQFSDSMVQAKNWKNFSVVSCI